MEIQEKLITELKNASETIYNLSKLLKPKKEPEGELTEITSKEALQYAVKYDRFNCPQKYYHFQYLKWTSEIKYNRKNEKYKIIWKNYEIKKEWNKNAIQKISKIENHSFGGIKEYYSECKELNEATEIFLITINEIIEQFGTKKKYELF